MLCESTVTSIKWQKGEGSQKVKTSSYKLNKSWGYNAQRGDSRMLTNLIMVIILQYIHVSNHCVTHLKLIQCMSIISIKLEIKKTHVLTTKNKVYTGGDTKVAVDSRGHIHL